jgi:hypothetical protein
VCEDRYGTRGQNSANGDNKGMEGGEGDLKALHGLVEVKLMKEIRKVYRSAGAIYGCNGAAEESRGDSDVGDKRNGVAFGKQGS